MENVGFAALQVIPSMKGFEGKLSAGTSPALSKVGVSSGEKFGGSFASKASSSIRSKFSETAKFIVAPLVGAFAVEKIGELIGDSIRLASDLNESQNKVQQVFKSSSSEVFNFAETADRAFGQTNQQARDAAATFGIFGRAAGLGDQKTAKFSIRMTKLASDLASFHNTSPEEAIEAIGAALRGESEPIRKYGVLLNDASLKAEALRLGLLKPVKDQAKIHAAQAAVLRDQQDYAKAVAESGKGSLDAFSAHTKLETAQTSLSKAVEGTIPQLTQQQKVLASQSLILQQTKVAQGDFARTSGGLANQQRILSATWEDAKAKLGKGLLPVVTGLVSEINEHVIPAVTDFSDWFSKDGSKSIGNFLTDAKPLANSVLPAVGSGLKDIGGFLKDAAPAAKSVFDAFNSLPDWAKKAVVLGAAGGFLAKKSGILGSPKSALTGGGTSGGLLGLISNTKPIPVFVTNQGFGGGVGGGTTGGRGGFFKSIPVIGSVITAGLISKQFAENEKANNLRRFGTNDIVQVAVVKLDRKLLANGIDPNSFRNVNVGPFTFAIPKESPHLKSLGDQTDALKEHLGQASAALDLVSRHGSQTFGGLSTKIDGTSTRTAILDRKLRGLPPTVRTELQFDDREARRRLAAFRAEAQKSLALELTGPHIGRPGAAPLDGLRRS